MDGQSETDIATSSSPRPAAACRSRFFFDPDVVLLRVTDADQRQDHLFKVHRYFLERDSELFRGMFMCPPEDASPEGLTEDNAIPLPGVTVFELECLLSFLYEGMYEHVVSLEEWVALLSISSRLLFDKIRERAISAISAHDPVLDPVHRIVLATKHDIPQWLAPAFTELCTRAEPLSEDEEKRLGPDVAERVERAIDTVKRRVRHNQPGSFGYSKAFTGCGCKDCRQARSESVQASFEAAVRNVVLEVLGE